MPAGGGGRCSQEGGGIGGLSIKAGPPIVNSIHNESAKL